MLELERAMNQSMLRTQEGAGATPRTGSYTCTLHNCMLRFDTPEELHRHRRGYHEEPAAMIRAGDKRGPMFSRLERPEHPPELNHTAFLRYTISPWIQETSTNYSQGHPHIQPCDLCGSTSESGGHMRNCLFHATTTLQSQDYVSNSTHMNGFPVSDLRDQSRSLPHNQIKGITHPFKEIPASTAELDKAQNLATTLGETDDGAKKLKRSSYQNFRRDSDSISPQVTSEEGYDDPRLPLFPPESATKPPQELKTSRKDTRVRKHAEVGRSNREPSPATKRLRKMASTQPEPSQVRKQFACPYRKFDPEKYSISHHRTCALTGHDTIARLKAHLYKYHRMYQCPRCKQLFDMQDDLDAHQTAAKSCELLIGKDADGIDGFTAIVEKKLRSRKKSYSDQTTQEQWEDIFSMLFPYEKLEDPYFEPVQDHSDHSLIQFLQHKLPRSLEKQLEPFRDTEMAGYCLGRSELRCIVEEQLHKLYHDYRNKDYPGDWDR